MITINGYKISNEIIIKNRTELSKGFTFSIKIKNFVFNCLRHFL